jgi:hypothetical protein
MSTENLIFYKFMRVDYCKLSSYPTKDIIAELRREVAVRRRVFPDWVHTGRLKQADADRHIELMEAAIELIEVNNKPDQQNLFG